VTATATRAPARTRISFSFAADGAHAACLTGAGGAPLAVETWTFTGSGVDRRTLPTRHGETTWAQLLCRTDGRVLFTRPGRGQHRLALAEPAPTGHPAGQADGLTERELTTVDSAGLRLIPTVGPGLLALAVGHTAADRCVLWRVLDRQPWLEHMAELPGTLAGGCRLDVTGTLIGFNHHHDGAVRPVVLDSRTGVFAPLPGTEPGQHLLLGAPRSGTVLLAGASGGELRLGYARTDGTHAPRFPDVLDTVEGAVAPMAADPSGEHFALRVDRGARSRLVVYTPTRERIRHIDTPPGVISTMSGWGTDGLRFPFSAPTQPGGIATVDPATGRWGLASDHDEPDLIDARLHTFAGPAGPIEAVVYGDWHTARRVLVSLHGGPEAAAQLGFDPLMQDVAGAGIAVVAPNFRGSTGYGTAHQRALDHAWGGPDLADVRQLARQLAGDRTLMLHGTSYGAFLALLAAAADPHLWSHCVAVAPFLSGQRLYADASPAVRALVERLGGRTLVDDDLGPRDVTRLCDRIAARLLIIHGGNDDVIPVGQSRILREHLLRAGRREGPDFGYLETPTGGHDPLRGIHGPELAVRLVDFLLTR
jgi:pimeloyl-ACP methyl ester carboxylesterase